MARREDIALHHRQSADPASSDSGPQGHSSHSVWQSFTVSGPPPASASNSGAPSSHAGRSRIRFLGEGDSLLPRVWLPVVMLIGVKWFRGCLQGTLCRWRRSCTYDSSHALADGNISLMPGKVTATDRISAHTSSMLKSPAESAVPSEGDDSRCHLDDPG